MHTFTSNQLFNSEPVTNYIKRILAESRSWATSVPLNFDFAPDKSFKGYAYQLFRVYKNKYKVHKPQIYFLDIERRFDENQSPQIVIYKVKYLGIKELFYLKPHSSNINNLNLRFTLVEDDYPRNTNEHPKISSGFINIYYDTECNDRESAKNKAIEFESSSLPS